MSGSMGKTSRVDDPPLRASAPVCNWSTQVHHSLRPFPSSAMTTSSGRGRCMSTATVPLERQQRGWARPEASPGPGLADPMGQVVQRRQRSWPQGGKTSAEGGERKDPEKQRQGPVAGRLGIQGPKRESLLPRLSLDRHLPGQLRGPPRGLGVQRVPRQAHPR